MLLKKVSVIVVEGVSKSTGKNYAMLKLETGQALLDINLKPIFVNAEVLEVLKANELK